MKKTILLGVALVIAFSTLSMALDITIDAQRDAWFETLTGPADGWLYLPPESEGTTGVQPDDEYDCSALIWQAWDSTYYYFYAEVLDDYVTVNNTTTYENDNIEQKIDPDPFLIDETTTGVAATRMSALGVDDAEVPEAVQNVDSGEMTGGWAPTEEDWARVETDQGYNLEWRIPWDAIQQGDRVVNVGIGEVFGLAINVGDNDETSRNHVLRWASDLGDLVWNEPKRHGTVTFKENNILGLSTENAITNVDTNTVNYTPAATSVASDIETPMAFELAQNYPNPFNPTTTITYSLPNSAAVTLDVYNLLGVKVASLVSANVQQAGVHTLTFDASELNSGIYVYQLQAGNNVMSKKMMLIK